jgi:hypothetical protein
VALVHRVCAAALPRASVINGDNRFLVICVGIVAGSVGIAIESPDQKTQGFMVQIALPR